MPICLDKRKFLCQDKSERVKHARGHSNGGWCGRRDSNPNGFKSASLPKLGCGREFESLPGCQTLESNLCQFCRGGFSLISLFFSVLFPFRGRFFWTTQFGCGSRLMRSFRKSLGIFCLMVLMKKTIRKS